jgi:hypothetical protein
MYGDGHFGKGQMRLGAKDEDFVDYFIDILERWCGLKPAKSKKIKNGKPYFECYLHFKKASDFVKNLIQDKFQVSKMIINSNNLLVYKMFILGFSDSEGCIHIRKDKSGGTISMSNQKILVLESIRNMMIKIGFDENKIKIGFYNKAPNRDVYDLRFGSIDQLKIFYQKIGFTIQRKQLKLEKLIKEK